MSRFFTQLRGSFDEWPGEYRGRTLAKEASADPQSSQLHDNNPVLRSDTRGTRPCLCAQAAWKSHQTNVLRLLLPVPCSSNKATASPVQEVGKQGCFHDIALVYRLPYRERHLFVSSSVQAFSHVSKGFFLNTLVAWHSQGFMSTTMCQCSRPNKTSTSRTG